MPGIRKNHPASSLYEDLNRRLLLTAVLFTWESKARQASTLPFPFWESSSSWALQSDTSKSLDNLAQFLISRK